MTHPQAPRRILFCLAFLPVLAGMPVHAQEKDEPRIDPKVEKAVRAMADHIRGLKSFRVNVSISMNLTAPGMKQEVVSGYTLAAQRPDKLALLLNKSVIGTTVVSDGKSLYTYVPIEGRYRVTEAPANLGDALPLGAMLGPPIFASPTFGRDVLRALLAADPYEALMKDVTSARYVTAEEIGGAACDRMQFTTDDALWYMWVQNGDKPLPRKIAPDIPQQLARIARGMPGIKSDLKLEAAITFNDWAANESFPDAQFKFTPPEGVTLTESAPGRPGPEPARALLGKPAPPMKLDLLDGGKLDLGQYKDKDIVILDFWATWCMPCAITMPVLIDIANEYKGKGVVFFSVNVQEAPERIRDFLNRKNWSISVALDKTAEVSEEYGAEAIPHMVIVGKDGTIQAVHQGFNADMKETIKRSLDALLAGKTLVPAR